jgi:pimeloyl-ACP methyl ester carboxylesterase
VINPGGPGESGIEAAVNMLDSLPPQVRERFDFVGFDPRGVASSTPALWCNSDADNDRLRADPEVDYSPAGVEHIESETKAFVQRCVDKMGTGFLAKIGTVDVARDLDAIRAALGEDKLTYLGYSYGTRIGAAYAEAFPHNVRAMILDGAVDPNADPVEADIEQATAFQKAFDDYAADCAKDADCPLGTDPAKSVEVYRSMVDPLVEHPARTKDRRGLSYSDAIVGTIMSLYSPNLWKHLTNGLTQLKDGRGDTLQALADMYMRRDADGHYSNATDARIAVNCVDQPPLTERAKAVDEDRRMREVAPFMSYGEFTGHAPMPTCAFWPVPPTSQPHQVSAPGLPPPLVVSTTHDPATPFQAGVDLARQLGGVLLTFDGTQHTVVFQGNSCVDNYSTAYLIDGTLPPPGAKC